MAEHIDTSNPLFDPQAQKRICIVGAGANGLAVLKVLSETEQVRNGLWVLCAYEEREDIGGIWLPAPPTGNPPATPLYDSMTTNIPHPAMAFASFPFPPQTPLFPSAKTVLRYLEDYATHFNLRQFIQTNVRVKTARWSGDHAAWNVTLSSGESANYHVLICASGHYRHPRVPETPGLRTWLAFGRSMHSAWYRTPKAYTSYGKVVVVGGGPSARDICADLRDTGVFVLHSYSSSTEDLPANTPLYRKIPRIAEYRENGVLVLEDGSVESGVGYAILATGYEMSFPFLSDQALVRGTPDIPPPFPPHLHNSSYHVFPLAKHLFPLQTDYPYSSLIFTGLLTKVAPFPIFEDQARAIVRVLAEPGALDVAAESVALIERARRLAGTSDSEDPSAVARRWFVCSRHEGLRYREELNRFACPGSTWTVPESEVWIWEQKVPLRAAWAEVVKRGEASEWLKGVGKNGKQDWYRLCKKLIDTLDHEASHKDDPKL